MAANGDLDKLGAVLDLYSEMAEGDEATVGVTVTTAVPLDNELRMLVTQKCELDLGRNVVPDRACRSVNYRAVSSWSVNGHRRDASVRHQLEQAYKVMTQPGMNSEV